MENHRNRAIHMPCREAVMRRFFRLACQILAIAGCTAALAAEAGEQTFYKSVLRNGRVVYADAPAPDAKRTEKITVRTDTPGFEAVEKANRALEMSRQQLLHDAAARNARLVQLEGEIAAAYKEFQTAETGRETGREMQEGDRQGRRLLPQYAERQRALDSALKQARQKLDRLLAERAALS
jgi:hypothetical protein